MGLSYLKLVPNDFPYDVDEGIWHYCLWKIGGGSGCDDDDDAGRSESISRGEMKWALDELRNSPWGCNVSSGCVARGGSVDPATVFRDGLQHSSSGTSENCNNNDDTDRDDNDLDGTSGMSAFYYWVNPPHLQSMPDMHHAYILVSREGGNNGEEQEEGVDRGRPPPPV